MPDSDNQNPYRSPQAGLGAGSSLSPGALTEVMVSYLGGAAPWIRFMGILGYIGCAVMAVSGIVWISVMSLVEEQPRDLNSLAFVSAGLLFIAAAALLFFPARFAYNYGIRIRNYLQSNSEQELELAFRNNRSLWKFRGITAIVMLVLIPVLIVVCIILAVS
jgi:hypothetical protein